MNSILNAIYSFGNEIMFAISSLRIWDVIDIAIIAFAVYKGLTFFRESRAGQLIKGFGILIALYALANWLSLYVLRWVLSVVVNSALIILVVVFHPEIRRLLERVGSSKLTGTLFANADNNIRDCLDCLSRSAGIMSKSKTGALVVIERKTSLSEVASTGTIIDAQASVSIIDNIFFPKSPLHDGALIIRDGRLYAAGCILPLTQSQELSSNLGTRHRAAVGMSENSDAVVVIVSEETGTISVAIDGKLKSGYTVSSLKTELFELFVSETDESAKSIKTLLRKKSINKDNADGEDVNK